jgi:hypothetical protein
VSLTLSKKNINPPASIVLRSTENISKRVVGWQKEDDEKKKHIITKLKSGEWTAWTIMKEYQIPMNYTHMIIKRGSWDKYLDEPNNVPEATENSK